MFRKATSTAFLCSAIAAPAALIAHYDFTDGDLTDNEVGPAETLTVVNNGATQLSITSEGAALFPGEGTADADYLQVDRSGAGAGQFTISMWFKTETVNQGSFQGLFSNNTANVAGNFSFQIDVNNGTLRLVSATSTFGSVTNAEAGEPQIQAGIWNHVVARKTAAGGAELWLGSDGNALELVGSSAINPGGLQWFRLGVNRNSDSLYAMEMANVKIYDDAGVSLTDLNNEGPQLVPEPGTSLLCLLALPGILRRRRS